MTEPTRLPAIIEPTEWLPSEYHDEWVPPTRQHPTSWLVQLSSGQWAIEDAEPVDGIDPAWVLDEGDVVNFDYRIDLAEGDLVVSYDDDGELHWHTTFDANVTAPAGTSLSVWSFDKHELWPNLHEAAVDLRNGTHPVQVYAWSYPSLAFRFTNGRFEPVRTDA